MNCTYTETELLNWVSKCMILRCFATPEALLHKQMKHIISILMVQYDTNVYAFNIAQYLSKS